MGGIVVLWEGLIKRRDGARSRLDWSLRAAKLYVGTSWVDMAPDGAGSVAALGLGAGLRRPRAAVQASWCLTMYRLHSAAAVIRRLAFLASPR
jgi:hypothetical protein